MKVYDKLEQGTDEWRKVRSGKITSSDFHTLLGKGETKDKILYKKAYERVTGCVIVNNYTNHNLERGRELESTARDLYELETGNDVKEVGFVKLDDFNGSSPDGLVGKDGLVEIKCPTVENWIKGKVKDWIAPQYKTQMQHQMYITGRKWCDFVIFCEELGLYIRRIERDEEYIKKIISTSEKVNSDISNIIQKLGLSNDRN